MTVTFETALTRLVGIDLPIVQAPIGGLARPDCSGRHRSERERPMMLARSPGPLAERGPE